MRVSFYRYLPIVALALSTTVIFSSPAQASKFTPVTTAALSCTANLVPPSGPLRVQYQPSLNGVNLGNGSSWNPFVGITPAQFCRLMAEEVCSYIQKNFPAGYHNALIGGTQHIGWVKYPFNIAVSEVVSGTPNQFNLTCR